MKAACIVPISALHLVAHHDYHLVLAHIALSVPDYSKFFLPPKYDRFLILDNSVYELGAALGVDKLSLAVRTLDPNVMVVPDSIWNAEENLRLTEEFAQTADTLKLHYPDLEFMAVPHGLSQRELDQNLSDLLESPYLTYIGLSKSSRKFGLRSVLAQRAASTGRKVHFLGVWEDPVVELLEGKNLNGIVTGIDTKYVARLGLIGRTLLEPFPTPPRLDFFVDEDLYNPDWLSRQLEAYRWLAESEASSVRELEQEYRNGRF